MSTLVVGLTGGIGAGKSTVASFFKSHQVPVIELDQLAKDALTAPAEPYEAVCHRWPWAMTAQGLNRRAIRQHCFTHLEDKAWLEAQVHPWVSQRVQARIQSCQSPYLMIVHPLLIERPPTYPVHRMVVVDCDESTQLTRAAARDNSAPEAIQAIMATQCSRAERLKQADAIIHNEINDSLTTLSSQVAQVHQQCLQWAKAHQNNQSQEELGL